MKALQRRNYSFDTRSVMLFAALSWGCGCLAGTDLLLFLSSPIRPCEQEHCTVRLRFFGGAQQWRRLHRCRCRL